MKPGDFLSGEDCYYVCVAAHSDAERRVATVAIQDKYIGGDTWTAAETWLAQRAEPVQLREHLLDPEGRGCGCGDVGWWCVDGEGRRLPFYQFDAAHVHAVEDDIWGEVADVQAG